MQLKIICHIKNQDLNLNEKGQSIDTNIEMMTEMLELSDKGFTAAFIKALWQAIKQAI